MKTDRLVLINSSVDILQRMVNDTSQVAAWLDIDIPDAWTEFGASPFEYALKKTKDNPSETLWWSWLPVLESENRLIGNGGYKGPPKEGVLEIGYEVAPAYRNLGIATEIAGALVKNAFLNPHVHTIIAHTLAEENASVHVLRKCGFQFVEAIDDPEDGLIWKWRLAKWG